MESSIKKVLCRKNKNALIYIVLFFLSLSVLFSCAPPKRTARGFKPKPCLECHTEQLGEYQKMYVHSPVNQGNCEACHLRHGKLPIKVFVEKEEKKLCLNCHAKMASDLDSMAHVHSALKLGNCLTCHDPHASDNAGLQKMVGSEQCFICHSEDIYKRNNKRHKPLENECFTCHSAHGSQHEGNLIREGVELCRSCHQFPKYKVKFLLQRMSCVPSKPKMRR